VSAFWWWDVKTARARLRIPLTSSRSSWTCRYDGRARRSGRGVRLRLFPAAGSAVRAAVLAGYYAVRSRGAARFPDTVHFDDWEGGTQLPILFAALNDRSAWLHPGPGSAHFADQPFSPYQHFDFRVGSTELLTAVKAMKRRWPQLAEVSEEPRDFHLTHFNVNPKCTRPMEVEAAWGSRCVTSGSCSSRGVRSELHHHMLRSNIPRGFTSGYN